ncbi:MAG TPA: hypothetical protein VJY33_03505, partial [Isosphaeraceae bacterium]|nr:hypothetical protein [Isosphaeraceae bacterium]
MRESVCSGRVSHGDNLAIFPGEVQAAAVAGKTGCPQSPIVGVALSIHLKTSGIGCIVGFGL